MWDTLEESSAAPRPRMLGAAASQVSSASHESQKDLDKDAMDKVLISVEPLPSESTTQDTLRESSGAPSLPKLGATASRVSSASHESQKDLDKDAMDKVLISVEPLPSESTMQDTLREPSGAPSPPKLGATASRVSSASDKSQSDLDQDAMDKVLTMCKKPSVLSDDVLRGVPMSFIMRRFGSLWRTSPLDRTPSAAGELWGKSRQCDSLDTFLSHPWKTPGWQKYMTLLLMFYSVPAWCSFFLTSILLFALDLASFLPMLEMDHREGNGSTTVLELFPWGTIPVWVYLLVLFAGPSCRCVRDRNAFFDAVCINQVDDDLKRAGIYSLSGILAKSHELTILWSPPYLNRLWCVYELATYAVIKPDGRINLCPVFKYLAQLVGFIGATAFTGSGTLFLAVGVTRIGDTAISFHSGFIVSIVPFMIMVRQWLPLVRAQRQLIEQLEGFALDNAACREEKDRAFIVQSIQQLYGSEAAFDAYVRGPLKDRVRQSLPEFGLRYLEVLGMSTPFATKYCEWIAAFARQGRSWVELGDLTLQAIAAFAFFCPSVIKLTQLLVSRSAVQRPSRCADTAIAIRTSIAMYVVILLILWAQWAGPHRVPMFGLWWLIGGGALTRLLFYLDSPQASKRKSDCPASGGGG